MARTALHITSTDGNSEAMPQHVRNHADPSFNSDNFQSSDACQRHLDSLLGFTYLESFDELGRWCSNDVDPISISNTPLLERQPRLESVPGKSSKVMLIHDYQGGYNRYEACQGAFTNADMYSCEYLQHVETFVYFSHKLVTIPPPTWINSCHRNGVYCLGTFIVEPGTKDMQCILEADELGSFWVASQLAQIAEIYGFDGWLINIEESFPLLSWSIDRMEGFLRQLRRDVGTQRRVVWYDALTTLNFVWYQNTLNSLNLAFASAAGSILTNYAWTPELAMPARHIAEKSGLGLDNVYFGIDMWAQNIQTGRHRRVTYPVKGGGGTGTGLGLKSLKELGLNTGIFAPGWSFEHFPTASCRAVERSIWLGDELPVDLACDCLPETPHELVPYRYNGIIEHAERYPSGTRSFFHTDFTRALNPTTSRAFFPHIGAQSVLPLRSTAVLDSTSQQTPRSYRIYDRSVSASLSSVPARLIISIDSPQEPVLSNRVTAILPLFDLFISASNTHELSVSFRNPEMSPCTLMLVVQWSLGHQHRIELPHKSHDVQNIKKHLPSKEEAISGISLEVICADERMLPKSKISILELFSLTIQPSGIDQCCDITNLRLEERGEAERRHHRLAWEVDGWKHEQAWESSGISFSATTGPCAYFMVEINGNPAGRAYALEFVVPGNTERVVGLDGTIEAQITAIGFDGRILAKKGETLHWPVGDEDWVLVSRKDGDGA